MSELDAGVKVEKAGFQWRVSDDQLEVSARLESDPPEPLSPDDFIEILSEYKIKADIDREALSEVLKKKSEDWTRIAAGTPHIPPVHGQLEYLIDLEKVSGAATVDETGRADYKDVQDFLMVTKEQPLIRRRPAEEGQSGKDVFGKEIPAPPAELAPLPEGNGIEVRENGLLAVAAFDGALTYRKEKLVVVEVYIVPGNVSYSTGNVRFDGSIEIKGDVLAGFEVVGGADVLIRGIVETTKIEAKGNIEILGGFQGANKGSLKAGGSIHAGFANEAVLEAGEDIVLKTSLMNSETVAGGSVVLQSPKGVIAGGSVRAADRIVAAFLGSKMGVVTKLQIGPDMEQDEQEEAGEEEEAPQGETAVLIERAKAGKIVASNTAYQGVVIRFPKNHLVLDHDIRHTTYFMEKWEIHTKAG